MVIDSSALVAIVRREAEGPAMVRAMAGAKCVMSAVTLLESSIVVEGRWGSVLMEHLEFLLQGARVEVIPFDEVQAKAARRAWRKYGKGRHPAGLNLGDCCVYALAELRDEPILAKGNDFALTPIQVIALDSV